MDLMDIYEDLDDFHEKEEKKTKELLALEEKYNEALKTIEVMQAEKKDLRKKIRIMELNLQSLLDTAKAEIKRKDKIIDELRKEKDDICFRRQKVHAARNSASGGHSNLQPESMPKDINERKKPQIFEKEQTQSAEITDNALESQTLKDFYTMDKKSIEIENEHKQESIEANLPDDDVYDVFTFDQGNAIKSKANDCLKLSSSSSYIGQGIDKNRDCHKSKDKIYSDYNERSSDEKSYKSDFLKCQSDYEIPGRDHRNRARHRSTSNDSSKSHGDAKSKIRSSKNENINSKKSEGGSKNCKAKYLDQHRSSSKEIYHKDVNNYNRSRDSNKIDSKGQELDGENVRSNYTIHRDDRDFQTSGRRNHSHERRSRSRDRDKHRSNYERKQSGKHADRNDDHSLRSDKQNRNHGQNDSKHNYKTQNKNHYQSKDLCDSSEHAKKSSPNRKRLRIMDGETYDKSSLSSDKCKEDGKLDERKFSDKEEFDSRNATADNQATAFNTKENSRNSGNSTKTVASKSVNQKDQSSTFFNEQNEFETIVDLTFKKAPVDETQPAENSNLSKIYTNMDTPKKIALFDGLFGDSLKQNEQQTCGDGELLAVVEEMLDRTGSNSSTTSSDANTDVSDRSTKTTNSVEGYKNAAPLSQINADTDGGNSSSSVISNCSVSDSSEKLHGVIESKKACLSEFDESIRAFNENIAKTLIKEAVIRRSNTEITAKFQTDPVETTIIDDDAIILPPNMTEKQENQLNNTQILKKLNPSTAFKKSEVDKTLSNDQKTISVDENEQHIKPVIMEEIKGENLSKLNEIISANCTTVVEKTTEDKVKVLNESGKLPGGNIVNEAVSCNSKITSGYAIKNNTEGTASFDHSVAMIINASKSIKSDSKDKVKHINTPNSILATSEKLDKKAVVINQPTEIGDITPTPSKHKNLTADAIVSSDILSVEQSTAALSITALAMARPNNVINRNTSSNIATTNEELKSKTMLNAATTSFENVILSKTEKSTANANKDMTASKESTEIPTTALPRAQNLSSQTLISNDINDLSDTKALNVDFRKSESADMADLRHKKMKSDVITVTAQDFVDNGNVLIVLNASKIKECGDIKVLDKTETTRANFEAKRHPGKEKGSILPDLSPCNDKTGLKNIIKESTFSDNQLTVAPTTRGASNVEIVGLNNSKTAQLELVNLGMKPKTGKPTQLSDALTIMHKAAKTTKALIDSLSPINKTSFKDENEAVLPAQTKTINSKDNTTATTSIINDNFKSEISSANENKNENNLKSNTASKLDQEKIQPAKIDDIKPIVLCKQNDNQVSIDDNKLIVKQNVISKITFSVDPHQQSQPQAVKILNKTTNDSIETPFKAQSCADPKLVLKKVSPIQTKQKKYNKKVINNTKNEIKHVLDAENKLKVLKTTSDAQNALSVKNLQTEAFAKQAPKIDKANKIKTMEVFATKENSPLNLQIEPHRSLQEKIVEVNTATIVGIGSTSRDRSRYYGQGLSPLDLGAAATTAETTTIAGNKTALELQKLQIEQLEKEQQNIHETKALTANAGTKNLFQIEESNTGYIQNHKKVNETVNEAKKLAAINVVDVALQGFPTQNQTTEEINEKLCSPLFYHTSSDESSSDLLPLAHLKRKEKVKITENICLPTSFKAKQTYSKIKSKIYLPTTEVKETTVTKSFPRSTRPMITAKIDLIKPYTSLQTTALAFGPALNMKTKENCDKGMTFENMTTERQLGPPMMQNSLQTIEAETSNDPNDLNTNESLVSNNETFHENTNAAISSSTQALQQSNDLTSKKKVIKRQKRVQKAQTKKTKMKSPGKSYIKLDVATKNKGCKRLNLLNDNQAGQPKPKRRCVAKKTTIVNKTEAQLTQMSPSLPLLVDIPEQADSNIDSKLNTVDEFKAMLIAETSPLNTPASQGTFDDSKFLDIDKSMQAIFASPNKIHEEISANDVNNSTMISETQTENDTKFDSAQERELELAVSSILLPDTSNITNNFECKNSSIDNSFELKRLSLGASEYLVERVSENVVSMFITRKRRKKPKNSKTEAN